MHPTESFLHSSGGVPTLVYGRRNLGRSRLSNSDDEEDDEAWRKQIDGGGDLTDRFKHKVCNYAVKTVEHISLYNLKLIDHNVETANYYRYML